MSGAGARNAVIADQGGSLEELVPIILWHLTSVFCVIKRITDYNSFLLELVASSDRLSDLILGVPEPDYAESLPPSGDEIGLSSSG